MTKILELRQIKKDFNNGGLLNILDGICLTVNAGQSISVVGKSGSGKSTLLHIAGGLESPTEGSLFVEDKDFYTYPDKKQSKIRNTTFGFIFQSNYLLEDFNAYENILIPSQILGKSNPERAEELLKRVGLEDRRHHKPSQLSGGERQRIAVCRALMNRPEIIFADEPTGSLDEENAFVMENLLLDMVNEEGRTLFLVTHNPTFAKKCSQRYLLTNKNLVLLEDEN